MSIIFLELAAATVFRLAAALHQLHGLCGSGQHHAQTCYRPAHPVLLLAQVAVAALNFLFGFGTVTTSYVMQLIPKTQAVQRVLVHFFRLFPPFLLGEGLIELTRFQFFMSLAEAQGEGVPWPFLNLLGYAHIHVRHEQKFAPYSIIHPGVCVSAMASTAVHTSAAIACDVSKRIS